MNLSGCKILHDLCKAVFHFLPFCSFIIVIIIYYYYFEIQYFLKLTKSGMGLMGEMPSLQCVLMVSAGMVKMDEFPAVQFMYYLNS